MSDSPNVSRETSKAPKDTALEEKLAIRYVRLDDAVGMLWRDNPKLHDMQGLVESFEMHGFRDAPAFDANLQDGGGVHDGNGRVEALAWMHDQGRDPPRGILLDDADGMWCLPIQFGVDSASLGAAQALAVDINNLTMSGGDLTVFDQLRVWDSEPYLELLKGLGENGYFSVSVDGNALDALLQSFTPEDYSDLDAELEHLEGYQEVDVKITVPAMYEGQVMDWLANGESLTAPGMGKGVLKRCGLL